MSETSIEWTDKTWNPVRGCSRVSPGCQNCYAERIAARFSDPGGAFEGFAKRSSSGGRWTGKVGLLDAKKLAEPLTWKKPIRCFVNSTSDLFHENLLNEEIAAVFGVMAACPHITFQVLTKRADRMESWATDPTTPALVDKFRHIALAGRLGEYFAEERILPIDGWPGYWITNKGRVLSDHKGSRRELKPMSGEQGHCRVMLYRGDDETSRPLIHRLVLSAFDRAQPDDDIQGCHIDGDSANNALWNLRWGTQVDNWDDRKRHGNRRSHSKLTEEQVIEIRELAATGTSGAEIGRRFGISDTQARNIVSGKHWTPQYEPAWPLPSVWLGVSVEDQKRADERIPHLLRTPAAVRFLSVEPLLGPLDLKGWGDKAPLYDLDAAPPTWVEYPWPDWVPVEQRLQIESFWLDSWGRGPRGWLRDHALQHVPATGARIGYDLDSFGWARVNKMSVSGLTGLYLHSWNNIGRIVTDDGQVLCAAGGSGSGWLDEWADGTLLHWVIVGGESGSKARPCDVAWVRSIVRACRTASVPVFVKQLGANVIDRNDAGFELDPERPDSWPEPLDVEHDVNGFREEFQGADCRVVLRDRKGGKPEEWPIDLRVRQFPDVRQPGLFDGGGQP